MNIKFRRFVSLLMFVSALISLCSCADSSDDTRYLLESALKMTLPDYTIYKYTNTHSGYSGELYAVIDFSDSDAAEFYSEARTSSAWQTLPVSGISYANVSWLGTLTAESNVGKIPSDIENGIWYFMDRSYIYDYYFRRFETEESSFDSILSDAETCTNFVLAVYNSDEKRLYVYVYDEVPE